ncbi:hypothetical protein IQ13_4183 [Lacibacter cauensis]|uniref:Uncharacterized protein n=1 Tax=Lacibacter cauensis TaxID=510947 RepID=A0A562S948_9BACT|nr:hypothetical protein [Lacibacter cauensis]TWI77941.1 hypothetical protein IQ13_4183 [Lacibacter cauensis]
MDHAIIPECYVDTNLAETLTPPQKQYNHQKGCGTVTKVMKEKFKDSFAVGIIDKDKKEVDYLKEFSEIAKSKGLILHKHNNKDKHHYIIQISPAMERFLFDCMQEAGVSPSNYGLPDNFDAFKKQAKTVTSKDDDRFKRLFKDLRKKGSSEISLLEALLKYLKQKNYKADYTELKAFFV